MEKMLQMFQWRWFELWFYVKSRPETLVTLVLRDWLNCGRKTFILLGSGTCWKLSNVIRLVHSASAETWWVDEAEHTVQSCWSVTYCTGSQISVVYSGGRTEKMRKKPEQSLMLTLIWPDRTNLQTPKMFRIHLRGNSKNSHILAAESRCRSSLISINKTWGSQRTKELQCHAACSCHKVPEEIQNLLERDWEKLRSAPVAPPSAFNCHHLTK